MLTKLVNKSCKSAEKLFILLLANYPSRCWGGGTTQHPNACSASGSMATPTSSGSVCPHVACPNLCGGDGVAMTAGTQRLGATLPSLSPWRHEEGGGRALSPASPLLLVWSHSPPTLNTGSRPISPLTPWLLPVGSRAGRRGGGPAHPVCSIACRERASPPSLHFRTLQGMEGAALEALTPLHHHHHGGVAATCCPNACTPIGCFQMPTHHKVLTWFLSLLNYLLFSIMMLPTIFFPK